MPKHKKSKTRTFVSNMVDISLNCLLFRDGEENYEFTIITNTANSVENFRKDIKEKIKGAGSDIFNDIEADQLMLWQVQIGNSDKEEFSNLTSDAKSKNLKKLEGIIGDHWAEQPLKEFIHVIVYSPYLTILRKLDSLTILSQALNPASISLQQLYNEQYIKQGNILFYNRIFNNVEFNYECKIKDIYNLKKLLVIPTFNEDMLMSFESLSEFELYILKSDDRFKNITRTIGCAYDWFFIMDKGVNKGSITELKRQYVKNKTTKKKEAENQKKLNIGPEKFGDRRLHPLLDPTRARSLKNVKKEFLMKFKKKIPFFCVCEGLVDDKEVIVAFLNQPEEEPVHLPAEFEGFPVLISYKPLVLYHRSFHKELMPGISIGYSDGPLNANTIGPLFQNAAEPNKTFILTAKHAVGKKDEAVVQPGTLDNVTKYNFIGADSACNYIDYAFCETVEEREIPEIPNVPFGQHIQIRSIKTSVNDDASFVYVRKVGRTTKFTKGLIQDTLESFYPPIIKKKNKKKKKKKPSGIRERFALPVFGLTDAETREYTPFSECGDSGAAVFDKDGKLWGICIAGVADVVSYVVPIHLILNDVKNKFNNVVKINTL